MQLSGVDQLENRTLGEYQIKRLLGHGQLGAAYLARQLSQDRTVMITTFNLPDGISAQEHDQLIVRFAQEGAALARLTHPNILPIYDFCEQPGYLCLVTAFVKGASLGQVLKQQGRFTPQQTLDVLKQIASGLDYAHSQGVVHGILRLSNVLLCYDLTVQIAAFGLRAMLEAYGQRQDRQPQAYLFSSSGALLGSPEYVSPESMLGKPVDARSDIYALGVMLFELLSGTLPFSGANPLDMALKRIEQPVPSLHAVCPDVPEAFDLMLSKTLERDPAKRYQHAGDLVAAFERVLTMLETTQQATDSRIQQLAQGPQLTLPPTVNWFEEAVITSEKWQLMPPIVSGHMPVVTTSSSAGKTAPLAQGSRQMHPSPTVQPDSPTEMVPTKEPLPPPAGSSPESLAGVDPFAWWSATSPNPGAPPAPGTFTQRSPVRLARSNPRSRRRPAQQDRRKLVKLIALGTAGALTVSGISFAHFIQSLKQSQTQIANAPAAGSTAPATTQGNSPTVGTTTGTQMTPGSSNSPTAQTSPSTTKTTQPSPTSQPAPKPTQPPQPSPPPGHTGTVIGYTNQATNSSKNFANPADGQSSTLIHLSNGNFVACERACTHQGVSVNYDSGSGKLVCPAHGAIFDPANGFSQVPGAGPSGLGPLAKVTIRINADGTITTG